MLVERIIEMYSVGAIADVGMGSIGIIPVALGNTKNKKSNNDSIEIIKKKSINDDKK